MGVWVKVRVRVRVRVGARVGVRDLVDLRVGARCDHLVSPSPTYSTMTMTMATCALSSQM